MLRKCHGLGLRCGLETPKHISELNGAIAFLMLSQIDQAHSLLDSVVSHEYL